MLKEPIQVTLGGKTFKACYLTQKIQSDWQQWIARQELQLLRDSQGDLTIDEYDRALSNHRFKARADGYALGTPENERWLKTKEGFKYLMWLCFTQAGTAVIEDELTGLIEAHQTEFTDLWKQIVEEYVEAGSKKEIPGS